jgi:L-methionine (R)-S-oxide reductase
LTTAKLNSEGVLKALHAAYCHEASRQDLLQLTATKLRAVGSPYTGVYMYMLDGDTLKLEAFDGRPTDHQEIAVGVGLCGKAVAEKQDLNVADVKADTEYLACSIETKSELIVLIRRGDLILGQIDVDSDKIDGFDAEEQAAAQRVADGLASLL